MVQYQPTVAFNMPSVNNEECLPVAHSKYGLSLSQAEYLSRPQKELQKNCLKELVCKDGLYTWKIPGSSSNEKGNNWILGNFLADCLTIFDETF